MWHRADVGILLVEDDDAIAGPMTEGLARVGFAVTRATTGGSALTSLSAATASGDDIELVLLDLGLPDMDGMDVCRAIRATSRVPIIVVSARGDELDRVILLELGADDYLVKPFGVRELVARVRAVLRRTEPNDVAGSESPGTPESTELRAGKVVLDPRTRRVTADGALIEMTPKEFDLLAYLMSEPGRVFRRQEILEHVWDPHWYGPSKTIDVHLAGIRKKFGDTIEISTVRGVGVRVEP
jgi:DNA-binding response OmpR family regulator